MDIKLPQMPDRTPVELSFMASAELKQSLDLYAEAYQRQYGNSEPVEELIPHMLLNFMRHDSHFAKELRARKKLAKNGTHTTLHARA